MSSLISTINLEKSDELAKTQLSESCKAIDSIGKLSKINEFFTSDVWKEMKCTNLNKAHHYANEYLTNVMGNINFAIYDNGKALYDKSGIISKLTTEQKKSLDLIDNSGTSEMFKVDNLIMMYIGSTILTAGETYHIGYTEADIKFVQIGDKSYDINLKNGMLKKAAEWITVANMSYSAFTNVATNEPSIQLVITSSSNQSFNLNGGIFTFNIQNTVVVINGITYKAINQTINSVDGMTYTINDNILTVIFPKATFTIVSGNYTLDYEIV